MVWYDYHITQGFKWTDHHRNWHSGVDLGAPWHTPVTAAASGIVVFAECRPWGGQVDILTMRGGAAYVVTVLHLHSMLVNKNQHVAQGQLIGYSGGDGRGPCPTQMPKYSDGPHIHFELTLGSVGPYHGGPPYKVNANNFTVDPTPLLYALRTGGSEALPSGAAGATGAFDSSTLSALQAASSGGDSSGFPSLAALFDVPTATVDAINSMPGIDNLLYRLHDVETFPGWKSLDQVAPLGTLAAVQSGTAAANAAANAAASSGIIGAIGGAVLGAGATQAAGAASTIGAVLSPGRLVYWLVGNMLGNARAAFVRLVYLGIGGMLFLALVIAIGNAQINVTLDTAEKVTEAVGPALEAAAVVA